MATSDRLLIGADAALLEDAARFAAKARIVGPSIVQRKVRVGFAKAARLVLLLEQEGLVGPPDAKGVHLPLIGPDDLPVALDRIREAARKENDGGD